MRRPRIPRALRGSALGDLLAGHLDIAGYAALLHRSPAAVEEMLVALGLDQLLAA